MRLEQGITATEAQPPPRKSSTARWVLLVVGLALVGVGIFFMRGRAKAASTTAAASASASADRPIPVLLAPVERKDVPIYREGLGSVTPLYTVTVKTQVDGVLEKMMFVEGQKVKKGEQIVQVDPRPFLNQLHTAQATLARDQASLRNTKLDLDRYVSLRQQNLIPQQQLDTQKSTVDQAQAAIMSDQASIDAANLQLTYARIVSPIDGVTGIRLVDPGNVVHATDTTGIVVITQLDPIAVIFTLPQDDLTAVARELSGSALPVEAFSRDGSQDLAKGKLALIDNEINQATATMKLKALFDNPARLLWPSEFVKARLTLSTRKNVVVIPVTAVQRGPTGTFTYVVGPDQRVSVQPIEIDLTQGDIAIITKGLDVGQTVVTDGQNQLKPGSRISVRPQGAPAASSTGRSGGGLMGAPGSSPSGSSARPAGTTAP
jgi:multidrug efflux system membrane fusion protein